MKKVLLNFTLGLFPIVLISCENHQNDRMECDELVAHHFDRDSILTFYIPKNWDTTNTPFFGSSEYLYYNYLANKERAEDLVVDRRKFKNPVIDFDERLNFLKTSVFSNPSNSNSKLLKQSISHFGFQKVGKMIFSFTSGNKIYYQGSLFYFNSDSSVTTAKITISGKDSAESHKKIECILNSAKVRE